MLKPVLVRITTVPLSLRLLLRGQFHYFTKMGFDVHTISSNGDDLASILDEGAEHHVIPFTRTISPFHDLYCLISTVRLLRKLRPQIVHTHTPKAGLIGMLAACICRVPVRMHTVAGLPLMEASGIKRFVLNLTERITYACSSRIYPNSKGLYEFIHHEFGITESKMKIIGKGSSNGIDPVYFSRTESLEEQAIKIRVQWKIKNEDHVFGFVGRLVRDKGLIELVEAFQRLQDPAGRLLLVGSFEETLDPLPDSIVQFLQTDSRVILAGFQNDVRPWMMSMTVFVFPSYREGFPNVVMQAACLEVPCIVSDINGCNELISHNVTGLVVPVKNTSALFEAMHNASDNYGKSKLMAQAACKFVGTNYSQQFVWKELQKEYEYLLDSQIA